MTRLVDIKNYKFLRWTIHIIIHVMGEINSSMCFWIVSFHQFICTQNVKRYLGFFFQKVSLYSAGRSESNIKLYYQNPVNWTSYSSHINYIAHFKHGQEKPRSILLFKNCKRSTCESRRNSHMLNCFMPHYYIT